MSDALDRLRQKSRPKVQPRNTKVAQKSQDIQTSRHTDASKLKEAEASERVDAEPSQSEDIQKPRHTDKKASRYPESNVSRGLEDIEVKRSTFRLEVGLISRLHRLCQDNGISREVMIESMFEYMEQNPDALCQVVEVAESKNALRQQLANRKRAKAMIEKFG